MFQRLIFSPQREPWWWLAMRVRVCSTRKRQEWVRMRWCHVEKCKFLLQNSLLLTDLYGIHPSRVLGPTLVYTSRIWPVTALHPMLKCHPALLLQKSQSLEVSPVGGSPCCCHCGPTGTGQRKCSCHCQSRPSGSWRVLIATLPVRHAAQLPQPF